MKKLLALAALALSPLQAAHADEGMWTFNNFPKERVEQKYGFKPSDAWLEHVRLSSARIAGGCSASFVSGSGLAMTNHHCAEACIQALSTAQRDYIKSGFYAKTTADEVKCPDLEVNQLVQIHDVTERMNKATAGLEGAGFFDAQRGEMARIEKECQSSPQLRCEVVSLYHGGVYNLYKYRRFQDVRLVFAPEFAIAFFGGDPDNFEFPRYDLDIAFLRIYENGKPVQIDHHFKWSAAGAREGEVTFVSGNPGGTDRQLTVAELEYQRDVALPERLISYAETRGLLTEFQRRGPEEKRISNHILFGVENAFKALKGRWEALESRAFFASKVAAESALRAQIAKDPEKAKRYLPAFDAIARAESQLRRIRKPLVYVEEGGGFAGQLFHHARVLVRAAEERPRPNEKRLREYRESNLPALTQGLFGTVPIYDSLEILRLGHSLTKLRENLGADDPLVRKVLGKESPDELAAQLVKGTKLKDPEVRKKLWEGGEKAIAASRDPMIELARRVDPDARTIRKKYEDEVESALKQNDEIVAKARFDVQGQTTYPDATFTARLSYGQVKGYEENGHWVKPITVLGGAFERATGRAPFDLPQSWIEAKDRLELATPFNFCTTNDVVGGNSGSPVINRDGEIVGLIFDGNIHSLGGEYGFDESVNRAIAVHSAAIIEALRRIYGADRIVAELQPPARATR